MQRAKSAKLFEEALKYIPGGVNSPVRSWRAVGGEPFFAQKAAGSKVWDVDDNEYIDYVCTWGPSILGHAHRGVILSVQDAAANGTSFGIPNSLEVDMAKLICSWVPSVQKVRMTNSGTEATMSAIRLARGFTKRDKIIKFEGCYHGHVDSLLVKAGSGALTLGQPDSAGVPAALAALTISLPFNDLEAVKAALNANKNEVAAIILEPIPANAGLIPPKEEFLEGLRKLATEHGTVLIFDEVMTGFRVGKAGAQGLFGVGPDLTTFGKVIGGGLPVGAIGGKKEIMDFFAPLGPVYQAGTLSGNPVAMAAGLAQLRILDHDDGFDHLEEFGKQLEQATEKARAACKVPTTFYRYGSMFCLFFTAGPVHNLADAMKSDTKAFASYFHSLLDAGIYVAPSQFETGFLSCAHTPQDIDVTAKAMAEALARL